MKLWTGRIMMFHNILCDDRRVDAAMGFHAVQHRIIFFLNNNKTTDTAR